MVKAKTLRSFEKVGRPEFRYLLAGIVVLFLITFINSGPPFSAESPGLKVSGASLVTEVSPGESLNHPIIVALSPADTAVDVVLEVYPLGQSPDGSYLASSENSQYSAFPFINLDKSSLHLEPGDSSQVIASIQVPQNAGTGGRYALINLRTQPVDQGSVGVVRSVNIPVYLTYKDTDLIHSGQITGTGTGDIINGKSIDILTLFKNTGNHHFKVKSEVIISDSSGSVQEVLYTSLTHSSIVPEATRQLKATYIPRSELSVGKYSYSSKIRLEDGTLLDEVQGSFEIRESYTPPPAPVSLDVSPLSVGELKTDGGIISVLLDRGSVISQTHLSLVIFPGDQLPAPPAGCSLTGPCFRVDGLNGLLVKPAQVRVKYSSQDLEQADGGPCRLVLARWDQLTGKWIILKTTQDEKSLTLSAETDQFGIMTVMIEPVLTKNDWSRLWIALAAVVIIAVVLFRRKRT